MFTSTVLPPDSPFLSVSVTKRINFRAARLRCKYGLCGEEEKDLRQDFWMTIVRSSKRYDAARCPLDRYVGMVLNRRYKHHVRELARADQHPATPMALEDVSPMLVEGIQDKASATTMERSHLTTDLPVVLARLSADDRQLCQLLMECSPYEAARRMGVAASTVYRAIRRMRERFMAVGLNPIS